MSKLLEILSFIMSKASPVVSKAISLAPLPAGIAIGYFGHGAIKIGVDMLLMFLKLTFKL